jgi:hypothetical protein
MRQSRDHIIRRMAPRIMRRNNVSREQAIDILCKLSTPAIRKLAAKLYYEARQAAAIAGMRKIREAA